MPTYKQNCAQKYQRAIFIPAAFDDAGLSEKAFRVCCYLSRCADKHGRAWPQIRIIRKHCRGTLDSIVAAIRELEARGFLRIIRKKPAIYQMTNPEEWIFKDPVTTCSRNLERHVQGTPPTDPLPEPIGEPNKVPHIRYTNKVPQKTHTGLAAGSAVFPTLEQIRDYCAKLGLPESDADYFDTLWQGNGFTLNGDPIFDWRAVIENRKRSGWCPSQRPAAKKQKQKQKLRGL
jgi:hypothetical protein